MAKWYIYGLKYRYSENNLFDFTMLCNVSDKFFELLKQNLAYDIFIVN